MWSGRTPVCAVFGVRTDRTLGAHGPRRSLHRLSGGGVRRHVVPDSQKTFPLDHDLDLSSSGRGSGPASCP